VEVVFDLRRGGFNSYGRMGNEYSCYFEKPYKAG